MAHGIKGVAELEIGGERRRLVCDMNAADVLYEQRGEHWQVWLVEHFLGQEVEQEEVAGQGGKSARARRLKPLSPGETIETLFALLATDREDSDRSETVATLRREIGLGGLPSVQVALLHSVLAGFGLPGEFIEAVVKAAGEPRVTGAAGGTGATP